MSRQRRSRYVPKRNNRKTKGISKKMLSTGAIIFVVLLGLSVLFGGGDTSDSETDIVVPPAAASVEAPAQASDPADTATTVPPENQSTEVASAEPSPVETIPAEQPAEVPAEVPGPVTEAPAEEVPQTVDTPVVSDPVPVPVEAPAAAPADNSGDINLNDSNSYAPDYSEPDVTKAMPYGLSPDSRVYITATGKKYHSNPNCGNTKTAYESTLEEALNRGLEPCETCYGG